MKNRVTLSIAGEQYTIIADAGEDYIKQTAAMVDAKINELRAMPGSTYTSATVLAALDFADEYQKALNGSDGVKAQIKEYVDEIHRLQAQLDDAHKEIRQLQDALKSRPGSKR